MKTFAQFVEEEKRQLAFVSATSAYKRRQIDVFQFRARIEEILYALIYQGFSEPATLAEFDATVEKLIADLPSSIVLYEEKIRF